MAKNTIGSLIHAIGRLKYYIDRPKQYILLIVIILRILFTEKYLHNEKLIIRLPHKDADRDLYSWSIINFKHDGTKADPPGGFL